MDQHEYSSEEELAPEKKEKNPRWNGRRFRQIQTQTALQIEE